MAAKIILFDINETVLDLGALRPLFQAMFGDKVALEHWFSTLLHSSTVTSITNVKTNFRDLARVSMEKLAVTHDISEDSYKIDEILGSFGSLPAHGDIIEALKSLKDAKFTTIAFSNSSNELLSNQISNAGLSCYFDDIISIQDSGFFKPTPQAYNHAGSVLSKPLSDMRLVAAHDWDTHGALSASMNAAFLARGPMHYNELFQKPDIMGSSMGEIAQLIISKDS